MSCDPFKIHSVETGDQLLGWDAKILAPLPASVLTDYLVDACVRGKVHHPGIARVEALPGRSGHRPSISRAAPASGWAGDGHGSRAAAKESAGAAVHAAGIFDLGPVGKGVGSAVGVDQ
jgi:hypothetical protein